VGRRHRHSHKYRESSRLKRNSRVYEKRGTYHPKETAKGGSDSRDTGGESKDARVYFLGWASLKKQTDLSFSRKVQKISSGKWCVQVGHLARQGQSHLWILCLRGGSCMKGPSPKAYTHISWLLWTNTPKGGGNLGDLGGESTQWGTAGETV